jgi:hypothetical protein
VNTSANQPKEPEQDGGGAERRNSFKQEMVEMSRKRRLEQQQRAASNCQVKQKATSDLVLVQKISLLKKQNPSPISQPESILHPQPSSKPPMIDRSQIKFRTVAAPQPATPSNPSIPSDPAPSSTKMPQIATDFEEASFDR